MDTGKPRKTCVEVAGPYNESNQNERSTEQACVRHRTSIYFGFCTLNKSLPVLSTKMNGITMSVHLFSLCLCWVLVSTQWLTNCRCRKWQLFLTITRLQQEIKATTLTYFVAISHLHPSWTEDLQGTHCWQDDRDPILSTQDCAQTVPADLRPHRQMYSSRQDCTFVSIQVSSAWSCALCQVAGS